jgi:hypothetical protein
MKDSKKYSQNIKTLYTQLKKGSSKILCPDYEEPVDSLVHAMFSEHLTIAETDAAAKHFKNYFIDSNDLRVSRPEEIMEMMGKNDAVSRQTAVLIAGILHNIFETNDVVSLAELRKMGKKPARQALEELPGITAFAVDFCCLTSLQSHAIPLNETMLRYLRENDFVDPKAEFKDISGFLSRQISADKAYEFYFLMRKEAERWAASAAVVAKKKAAKKKTVKEAAPKKTTTKKTAAQKTTVKKTKPVINAKKTVKVAKKKAVKKTVKKSKKTTKTKK